MTMDSARIPLMAAVLAAGVMIACSSPEKELRKAKEAGTSEALDAFVARHPDSPLVQEAKDAKEQLAFDAAKKADMAAAYEEFIRTHPNGKLAGAARLAIEELDFKFAQSLGTVEAYENFLRQHPQTTIALKVRQALDALVPDGAIYARAEVASTESARCTVHSTVTLLHKSGGMKMDPPPEAIPGAMNCAGTIGASGVEIEQVESKDANHTLVRVKSYSTAGWGECRGTCTVRFNVMGQELVVTAVYK